MQSCESHTEGSRLLTLPWRFLIGDGDDGPTDHASFAGYLDHRHVSPALVPQLALPVQQLRGASARIPNRHPEQPFRALLTALTKQSTVTWPVPLQSKAGQVTSNSFPSAMFTP